MPDVPSLNKSAWPAYITDALGIPSIQGRGGPWQSTGDTTDVSWFHALCEFLGVDYPGERIRAMRVVLEAAGGTWDQRRHSSAVDEKRAGGNVRKEAFEDLWSALHESGALDANDRPSITADALTYSEADARLGARWAYRHIRLRQGQPGFRSRLLAAYGGRCCLTSADVPEVLEAAHIRSHAEGGSMATTNGLLLRADAHTMFDLGLIAVDTSVWAAIVQPHLLDTELGGALHGQRLQLPESTDDQPSTDALDDHRSRSNL